jgi:hypothetical protein
MGGIGVKIKRGLSLTWGCARLFVCGINVLGHGYGGKALCAGCYMCATRRQLPPHGGQGGVGGTK